MTPQNKPIFASNDWPDVQSGVESKMDNIEKKLPVLKTKDGYLKCSARQMSKLKKDLRKNQREMAKKLVEMDELLKNRNEAFRPHFSELQERIKKLLEYCGPKWNLFLALSAVDEYPLGESIRLMVDDRQLDRALTQTMTSNHSIAVLILQLAINLTIGSHFIIIDALDDFIEPCLIA